MRKSNKRIDKIYTYRQSTEQYAQLIGDSLYLTYQSVQNKEFGLPIATIYNCSNGMSVN